MSAHLPVLLIVVPMLGAPLCLLLRHRALSLAEGSTVLTQRAQRLVFA